MEFKVKKKRPGYQKTRALSRMGVVPPLWGLRAFREITKTVPHSQPLDRALEVQARPDAWNPLVRPSL